MNNPHQLFKKEKVLAILKELFRKFKHPLIFLDSHGNVLFGVGTDCHTAVSPPGSNHRSITEGGPIPIHFMGDKIGSLVVCFPQQDKAGLASVLAYCLENFLKSETEIDDLSAEVVRLYEDLSLLYSISNKLGTEMDVDMLCCRVLEEVDLILSPNNLSIMLLDRRKGELYTKHSIGKNADSARSFKADISFGLIGHVMRLGEPVTVCDIHVDGLDGQIYLPYPAKSVLCVPLITDGNAIGLLLACDKLSGDEFWSRELKIMATFAPEVAASIRKAQLYEDINKTFINTVEAFASALDAKDPYTYGHSRRVAQLSVIICEEMGIPKKVTRRVELAALLHDIGKIGTPENILHKPEKLEYEEFEKIKEHPAKGAAILSNIGEFSDIIKWIRHHHEWYDGKGYPDQIAAEHIPVQARIITIADAYDAMTSDRPYRRGMPPHEVIKIMEEFTRSQFDPEILEVFNRLMLSGKIDF
jgi:putative nucleotidyltransferase with HDIG domain